MLFSADSNEVFPLVERVKTRSGLALCSAWVLLLREVVYADCAFCRS